jgi:tRNA U34 5-methylaminomethyl-2-thiouridine-forming methyltransferase MnmC
MSKAPDPKPELHLSKDGSHTLYAPHLNQYYHNPNGAIAESRKIFFERAGTAERIKEDNGLTILEVGFGTGLNFLLLLSLVQSEGIKSPIIFSSVEAFPIDSETADGLNYPYLLQLDNGREILNRIFSGLNEGHNTFEFGPVTLNLFIGTFQNMPAPARAADIIFHDPFSPEKTPELWTREAFQKLKTMGKDDVVLATYGAASSARAAMSAAGWLVARAPGVLGKREMTLASPDVKKLAGLKRVNEQKLVERFYGVA